ncbi:MAG: hypothetical protein AAB434_09930 [Planctomycetota bacterium]
MPSTARSVRCRKCHSGYDHHKHANCPRCGAPSKPTAQTPAVAPGAPPATRPKKERMTPLMKVAAKGEMLIHGQPSILDPTKTGRREKRQSNNTPIIIGSVVGLVAIVGIALAMGDHGDDKGKKKGSPPPLAQGESASGTSAPADPGPAYQDPAKMGAKPPEAASQPSPQGPSEPLDPLDAEAQGRKQPPAVPGAGPDGASPPDGGDRPAPPRRDPPRAPAEWKVDPAIKAELGPMLKEMNDWPTVKIDEQKQKLAARGKEVIPALIDLVDNDDEMAAKWSCEILTYITGRPIATVMGTSRDDRRELSNQWKSWYQANAGSYDSAKSRNEEQILDQGIIWARKYKAASFSEAEEAVVKDLCATGDKEIVTGLVMVVGGEDKVLASRAHDCLLRLTGESMGDMPEADDGRKELAGKWDAWWKAKEASWQFPSR